MMLSLAPVAVLCLAFAGDVLAGDPPNRFHLVAWMGNAIAGCRKRCRFSSSPGRFAAGTALVIVGAVIMIGVGWSVERICAELPIWISVIVQAIVLKFTFAVRSLARAASMVAAALVNDQLDIARREVAYHLVSRDTSTLDASQVAAATIESVAENTSDSIVAPLFFYAVFGLPGALVYRFINTCDAMLGYHTDELEWFGKASARLDDLLNLIPARLTALAMLSIGLMDPYFRANRDDATRIWWRDHALTASPNAGHPMSAAAGVLGVSLEKEGHYRLGIELAEPTANSITGAIRLLWGTSMLAVLLLVGGLVLRVPV